MKEDNKELICKKRTIEEELKIINNKEGQETKIDSTEIGYINNKTKEDNKELICKKRTIEEELKIINNKIEVTGYNYILIGIGVSSVIILSSVIMIYKKIQEEKRRKEELKQKELENITLNKEDIQDNKEEVIVTQEKKLNGIILTVSSLLVLIGIVLSFVFKSKNNIESTKVII
jgi:hypothetical protein